MILTDRYTSTIELIRSCINTPYLGLNAAVGLIDAVQTPKDNYFDCGGISIVTLVSYEFLPLT